MGEPLEVRPLLRAKRFEDLVPETKALKELKPSFTRKARGKIPGSSILGILWVDLGSNNQMGFEKSENDRIWRTMEIK